MPAEVHSRGRGHPTAPVLTISQIVLLASRENLMIALASGSGLAGAASAGGGFGASVDCARLGGQASKDKIQGDAPGASPSPILMTPIRTVRQVDRYGGSDQPIKGGARHLTPLPAQNRT